jgi:polyhydroxybutyrate depolymerase
MAAQFSRPYLIILIMLVISSSASATVRKESVEIANALPGTPRPTVIFLHGSNGTGEQMQKYVHIDQDIGVKGVVAIYPSGRGGHWNVGLNPSMRDDVDYLDRMIDYYVAQKITDPSRIYIAGLSNGGMMAQRMVCQSRYPFAAVMVMAATRPKLVTCKTPKTTAMIFAFGSRDEYFPPDGKKGNAWAERTKPLSRAETLKFWEKANGCAKAVAPVDLPSTGPEVQVVMQGYKDCARPMMYFDIMGVGHVWPGAGSNPKLDQILGPNPDGFDLNQLLIKAWFLN